jgi:uncharacterized protein YdeI (YjbR/CyaY-like superfamily)
LSSDLLEEVLSKDSIARAEFENFTDYKKNEFIEYIENAKRSATKQRRLKKSMDLIRKGVGVNEIYK